MLVILLANLKNKDCKTTEQGFPLLLLPVRIVTFIETRGSHLNVSSFTVLTHPAENDTV